MYPVIRANLLHCPHFILLIAQVVLLLIMATHILMEAECTYPVVRVILLYCWPLLLLIVQVILPFIIVPRLLTEEDCISQASPTTNTRSFYRFSPAVLLILVRLMEEKYTIMAIINLMEEDYPPMPVESSLRASSRITQQPHLEMMSISILLFRIHLIHIASHSQIKQTE